MEYFMIIVITYASGIDMIKYPVDNYEHCIEIKDEVKKSIEFQMRFHEWQVRVSCPPIQPSR